MLYLVLCTSSQAFYLVIFNAYIHIYSPKLSPVNVKLRLQLLRGLRNFPEAAGRKDLDTDPLNKGESNLLAS